GTILLFINKYPNARTALLNWYQEFIKASFENFNQLKSTYGNASIVSNERVIFNIKGNDYRLIISINFKRQAAYIIWFGTHSEYDKIDAATVKYTL
ncbi:type II toxin-antitoxin system HigB family toxin, partial [uncultured Mucilaginibacter sp.]|uniref:type II toxin-antitoxin system HigB family toxin n=1 Tax=uncultured Mucilaginibacter sp. TaxID=797541 RepID=UPI00345BBDE3